MPEAHDASSDDGAGGAESFGTPRRRESGRSRAAGRSSRATSGRPHRSGGSTDRGPQPPTDASTDDRAADRDADSYSVAKAIALRQLTMAPRSRAQLRQAMDRKLVPPDVAEQVLDRLEEVKLVDDAAFAEGYVRYRQRERGLARRALAHELRTKGVDDETARAALDELDPEQELETARALVDRRIASTRGLEREARIRRLAGMLARKGYPAGIAMSVVREALTDDDQRADDQRADGLIERDDVPRTDDWP